MLCVFRARRASVAIYLISYIKKKPPPFGKEPSFFTRRTPAKTLYKTPVANLCVLCAFRGVLA